MPQLDFPFEIKSLSEQGEFTGYASTYGNRDSVDDVVMPGSFTRTLAAEKTRTLFYNHRISIGTAELVDSPEGLIAKGKLSLGLQEGRDAYVRLKDGIITAMSIGFQTVKDEVKGGVRYLKEIRLWEVSLVELPANSEARILSVKSAEIAELSQKFDALIREVTHWKLWN